MFFKTCCERNQYFLKKEKHKIRASSVDARNSRITVSKQTQQPTAFSQTKTFSQRMVSWSLSTRRALKTEKSFLSLRFSTCWTSWCTKRAPTVMFLPLASNLVQKEVMEQNERDKSEKGFRTYMLQTNRFIGFSSMTVSSVVSLYYSQ